MKAAVIHGPHSITCDNVADPRLEGDRDIILKVTATAICGSDLHLYSGAGYGGYDGGQAQYVRVPYADYGPRKVPDALTDEEVLFLTDIFPTGYTGVDWGQVRGGETVAIFGAGPVGLMAAKSAWLRGAERVFIIDTVGYRLEKAAGVANCETILWDDGPEAAISILRDATEGRGADLCIDAVGMEPARTMLEKAKAVVNMEKGSIKVVEACLSGVRRGGTVSILGVYGTTYDNFPLGQLFDKGVTIKCGQAPAHKFADELLNVVADGRVRLNDIITHRLPLTQIEHAYSIFQKKEDNCVKVVLDPWS